MKRTTTMEQRVPVSAASKAHLAKLKKIETDNANAFAPVKKSRWGVA